MFFILYFLFFIAVPVGICEICALICEICVPKNRVGVPAEIAFPRARDYTDAMPEGKNVQKMFAGIANRYDLANVLLSAGACRFWAMKLVRAARKKNPKIIADLATGSGDIAFILRKKLPAGTEIRGYDFCEPMLEIARSRQAEIVARERSRGREPKPEIAFFAGDCMNLPVPDNSLDALTIAYGVRNFENRERGLREMLRVLKPGGNAFILEFSQPTKLFRPFYYLYLRLFLPILAKVITGDKNAYEYLCSSISAFPHRDKFSDELRAAGFVNVSAEPFTFSIVAIHSAQKPE